MITEALAEFVLDTKAGDISERVYGRAGDALISGPCNALWRDLGVDGAERDDRRLRAVFDGKGGALEAYTVPARAAPVANSSMEGVKV